ncbi:LytTR family DNA-binding domain-containing protein [Catenovulum sp. 2E275]|uniref:LytR/AlgR family response regulator transcription factor n=1 Tax=Catenovulum sp. 2E275 TaxID=2980497 RepID=UPI0021D01F9B|nr:LytTR family DNA-binding domain-containing protein [Catenovulum sp. 2E275]MCU4677541.1 LytTR family DNA-binding domain-containing protein [Catenovulum sp. 2E275]
MTNLKALTAVIVDDEPLALEGLKLRLEKIPEINVIGEAQDGDQAITLCQQLQPDILFLDLQLPGLNGIEIVQALQTDIMPLIVFVSAYGEYAIDAFELNAIDYVMKPVNLGRLQKTVEKIMQRVEPKHNEAEKFRLLNALKETSGISISELEDWLKSDTPLPTQFASELVIKNSDNEKIFLSVSDIRWIDAAGDYMCVHTQGETHIVRITMKKLELELDERVFKRIHKSTLVNINYVQRVKTLRNSECILELGSDIQLKVSRNYSAAIQQFLESKQL